MTITKQTIWTTKYGVVISIAILLFPYTMLTFFILNLFPRHEMIFWTAFLFSLLPCSVSGWLLGNEYVKSKTALTITDEIIRGIVIVIGSLGIIAGLFALGLIYVVTS